MTLNSLCQWKWWLMWLIIKTWLFTRNCIVFSKPWSQSTSAIKLPPEVPMIENTFEQASEDVFKSTSESKELDTSVATPGPVTYKKPRLTTSIIVINKRTIIFELPKPSIVDQIDIDKLPSVDRENSCVDVPMPRLSFRERLEGWSIERRQHQNKSHDWFYHHPKSSRMFRSIPEVVDFLLYEIYPGTVKKEKKFMLDKEMTPTMKILCMSTSSADHRSEQEIARNIVEKFLRDSYNNLVNYGRKNLAENNDTESESQRTSI